MQPEIQLMLSVATDVEQVGAIISSACSAFGTVTKTDVMFTRQQPPQRHIMGIVELYDAIAPAVARTLGVESLGTRLVVFRYQAPEEFRIAERPVLSRSRPMETAAVG